MIKKSLCLPLFALLLLALPVRAQQADGTNLVQNSGFENGAESWSIRPNSAVVVADAAHSGKHSLYYTTTNRQKYEVFSQKLDVQPKQRLVFSVWVKGKDTTGNNQGTNIYMESIDANGKHVGGAYPISYQGTFDWKLAKWEYTVPDNAATTVVGLYLHTNEIGTVWFDDVDVHTKPSESFLEFPNYRGTIKQGNNTPWKVLVNIASQAGWKDGDIKIENTLTDAYGKVLLAHSILTAGSDTSTHIIFQPPLNLPVGNYTLAQTITHPNKQAGVPKKYPIHVVREMPKVYIDAQGFTVKNGRRIFPLGLYLLHATEDEDMKRISQGGFNTILAYGYGSDKDPQAYLDRAQKHNLNVILTLQSMYPGLLQDDTETLKKAGEYIKQLRDSPALLAWYTNDERSPDWMEKLEGMYNQVKSLDPGHPVYQVLYQVTVLKEYFDVTDVLGADPYLIGEENLARTSRDSRSVIAATRNAKGMWMVPQIMDWAMYKAERKPRPPTLDEMRNQAYQAIINGATGLMFYSYFDLWWTDSTRSKSDKAVFDKRWPDVTAMAAEIKALTPAILNGEKVALDLSDNSKVEVGALRYNGEMLLMLANPYYEEQKITFVLPQGWKILQKDQGQIKSTFADGKATFTLPSVGSGVFRLVKSVN